MEFAMTVEQVKQCRRERLQEMRELGYQPRWQRSIGLVEVIKWEGETGAAAVFELFVGGRVQWR